MNTAQNGKGDKVANDFRTEQWENSKLWYQNDVSEIGEITVKSGDATANGQILVPVKKENEMEEIKFRAWKNRCGFAYFKLGSNPVWNGEYNKNHGYYFTCISEADAIEQFTGLKDKNGKDIYVGDKLWTGDTLLGDVIFSDGSFRIFDPISNDVDSPICWDRTRRLEIIGNIHENAELLK